MACFPHQLGLLGNLLESLCGGAWGAHAGEMAKCLQPAYFHGAHLCGGLRGPDDDPITGRNAPGADVNWCG